MTKELTPYTTVPLPSGGSIVAVVKDGECFFSPRHVCQELGINWTGQRVKVKADPVLNSTVKEIVTVAQDGECFFSPRHVCEEMGIGWPSQYTKIKSDPVLSTTVTEIQTQLPGTPQARSMSMLPISMLSGWLFTIKKVAPAIQAMLTEGEDYVRYSAVSSDNPSAHNRVDFWLTLDAAKHIAMLERTEVGKAIDRETSLIRAEAARIRSLLFCPLPTATLNCYTGPRIRSQKVQ